MDKKTNSKSSKKTLDATTLKDQFMDQLLTSGYPHSVYSFSKNLGIQESEFYQFYNSFDHLEGDLWSDWFQDVLSTLESDEAYQEYTVREKILAFYFTWIQKAMQNRSYVILRFGEIKPGSIPPYLNKLEHSFRDHFHELMIEGKDTLEVASRPIDHYYPKALWVQFLMITKFWIKDQSQDFEKTDALIEKSVHFAMDVVAKGAIDSLQDLAKFVIANRETML